MEAQRRRVHILQVDDGDVAQVLLFLVDAAVDDYVVQVTGGGVVAFRLEGFGLGPLAFVGVVDGQVGGVEAFAAEEVQAHAADVVEAAPPLLDGLADAGHCGHFAFLLRLAPDFRRKVELMQM